MAHAALRRAKLSVLIRQVLSHVNFTFRTRVNGAEIKVPSINGIRCGATEVFMLDVLEPILASCSGSVVDVGVNVGQTLVKVKAIDPGRAYVGFEPNPSCVYYVRELIRVNGLTDCTVVPVGLFTHDGVLALLMIVDNSVDSAASLIATLRPPEYVRRVVHVPVMRYETISGYLQETVSVIKIDVEGAELEVMQTLAPLIERDRPVILLEILPAYSEDNRAQVDRQDAIERLLEGLGYVIDRVLKSKEGSLAGFERLTGFGIHGDLSLCDYVLSPRPEPPRGRAELDLRSHSPAKAESSTRTMD